MQRHTLVLLFLMPMTPTWAISSKEDCSKFAKSFGDTLPALTGFADELSKVDYWRNIEGRGELKIAVEAADAKRETLVPVMRSYISAIEDLTYQLQLCARD